MAKSPALIGHAVCYCRRDSREKLKLFYFYFSGRTFGLGAPPGAGWLDGVASDSNRILWRTTNPQRFRPHFGIRPVLDRSVGVDRNLTQHFR